MDFTDDLLAVIFRPLAMEHGALAVEHVPLAFFVSVKLVSRRMMILMRNRLHAEYQAAANLKIVQRMTIFMHFVCFC